MNDNDQQDQQDRPQDITCSGSFKLNLGAAFGDRPKDGDNNDE